jgi:NAD(P)-dependent dehydrogenase (short-subunit alcohol dehydrogenase family)
MNHPSTILVLGATGGIGSELCRRLRGRGANVLAAARNETRLNELAAATGAVPFLCDALQPAQVEAAFGRAAELFGAISGAANCVGSLMLKPAGLTSDEDWSTTIATNLHSAFHVVRAAAKAMAQAGGSVVLVSSAAARTGLPNHEAIGAAKAGIMGLALSAAASYAHRNLRFNCVAPGLTQTPLTARLTGNETARKASLAMHPLGRLGEPAQIASAIEWLLDPEQSWVTGQVLGVDGGLATVRPRQTA